MPVAGTFFLSMYGMSMVKDALPWSQIRLAQPSLFFLDIVSVFLHLSFFLHFSSASMEDGREKTVFPIPLSFLKTIFILQHSASDLLASARRCRSVRPTCFSWLAMWNHYSKCSHSQKAIMKSQDTMFNPSNKLGWTPLVTKNCETGWFLFSVAISCEKPHRLEKAFLENFPKATQLFSLPTPMAFPNEIPSCWVEWALHVIKYSGLYLDWASQVALRIKWLLNLGLRGLCWTPAAPSLTG